jgi:hypothetical protein
MSVDEAIAVFSSYSLKEKEEFLAGLMHELTIVARDSYEVGEDSLSNPRRVRRINEIQHRVSSVLWAMLRNDPNLYPDELIVKIILEHPEDTSLEGQLNTAFARLVALRLTVA